MIPKKAAISCIVLSSIIIGRVTDCCPCHAPQRQKTTRWEIVGTADSLLYFLLDILRPIGVTSWRRKTGPISGWVLTADGPNLVAAVLIDM